MHRASCTALLIATLLLIAGCSSAPSSDPGGTCDKFAGAVEAYSTKVGSPLTVFDGGIISNDIEQPGSSLNDRSYPLLFCSRTFKDPNGTSVFLFGSVAAPGPGQDYCDGPINLTASEDNALTASEIQRLAETTKTTVQSCSDERHSNSLVGQDGSWEAYVSSSSQPRDNPLANSDKFEGMTVTWLNAIEFNASF